MNEDNGFVLKPEMYNQNEWYQMYLSMLKECKKMQQENVQLKDKIERSFKIVDDKLTNLNLEYGVNNEFREEYDELWEILKEN